MTVETAESIEAEFRKKELTFSGGKRATIQQLHDAFDKVKNVTNWKLPVDEYVPNDQNVWLIKEAVAWFTGSYPTVTEVSGRTVRVQAPGYYNVIGS